MNAPTPSPARARVLARRTAIGVGALLALLVVAGAIFTATFDVNRYKPQIVGAVQERTGRTLRFDGDLSLSLFPRVAVQLPATTLSEPGRDAVFARLQSARASVALLPLLRREIVVDAIRVDGLQTTIVRRKDGSTNVDDLLKPEGAPAAAGKGPSPAPGPSATIGEVQLRNADLTLRDLAAGRTIRASELDLRAGRYAAGARMPIEANGTLAVSEPAFEARLNLKAEVEWSGEGALRAIRDLSLKAEGRFRQQPLTVEARAEQLMASAEAVEVRGLRLDANGKGEGGDATELKIVAPRLEASKARATGERIEVALVRRGPAPLEVALLIDGLRGTAARLEASSVKLTGMARSGPRTSRFDLAGALAGSVDERTLRFDKVTGEIAVEEPTLGPKPVRVPVTASGAVDGRRETGALQFDARGDGLSARGKVSIAGFASPRFTFDVDADQIDADRYLLSAAPPPSAPSQAGGVSAPAPADTKVGFGALKGLNVAGNVRVARLRLKGADVSELRATLKGSDGRLDVAPFALRVHGGSVNGRIGVDARANRVALAGTVSDIQLKRLIGQVGGGRAAVEGSASGTFDLATAGATVNQMKRALAGHAAVDVRDGALVGIDLADMIGAASSVLQSRGRQTGALDESKRTPFTQLSASVRIKDGVAVNDDLKARSAQLDIAGSGRMDVVSTELDYALRAQVLPGPATERGPLRSLVGLTVPVKITGPVEKPSYAVDWGPIAAEALLKRATGRSGTPAVNEMLEGLGDLFRRKK